jgi:hypothetical protein
MVVAFRRHTLLPLDDCLYASQPSIPHLTCRRRQAPSPAAVQPGPEPIVQVFAKLEHPMRKAAERSRKQHGVAGWLLDAFMPTDVANTSSAQDVDERNAMKLQRPSGSKG